MIACFLDSVLVVVGCLVGAWGREYHDGLRGMSSFGDGRQLGPIRSHSCRLTI